jgi:glucan phosphoethanolaminetransferase (alkaline phosphatase superfamily)
MNAGSSGDLPAGGSVQDVAEGWIVFPSIDVWLLPAIAAGSSCYLICLLWERFRASAAPSGFLAGLLSFLSFIMGGASAHYRATLYARSLENNIIVMFVVGASTTYLYLLIRKYISRTRT